MSFGYDLIYVTLFIMFRYPAQGLVAIFLCCFFLTFFHIMCATIFFFHHLFHTMCDHTLYEKMI